MATGLHDQPEIRIGDEAATDASVQQIVARVAVGHAQRSLAEPVLDGDCDDAYEVVDGQPTEGPDMGALPEQVASSLFLSLGSDIQAKNLGRTTVEPKFHVRPEQQRRPDVACFSYDRLPKKRRLPLSAPWPAIPELAIEVISQTDQAWAVMARVHEYLDAGVVVVWLIYPNVEIVQVYSSMTQVEVFTRDQTLTGGAVVAGFELPLADLFEETEEPGDEPTATAKPTA